MEAPTNFTEVDDLETNNCCLLDFVRFSRDSRDSKPWTVESSDQDFHRFSLPETAFEIMRPNNNKYQYLIPKFIKQEFK